MRRKAQTDRSVGRAPQPLSGTPLCKGNAQTCIKHDLPFGGENAEAAARFTRAQTFPTAPGTRIALERGRRKVVKRASAAVQGPVGIGESPRAC